jgi:enhancer of yellow 2 transcription factor
VNRPPTPEDTVEEQEGQEKQPTLQEIMKIKVLYLFS